MTRLRLRPLEPSDAPEVARLLGADREGVMCLASMPWPVIEEECRIWIAARKGKAGHPFSVLRREDGAYLGGVGFSLGQETGGREGEAEIGYWMGREFRGRGYASEAVGLVLDLAARMGATLAAALVFPDNPASERVLVKNGFQLIGEEEGDFPLRGGKRIVIRFERVL